MESPANGKPYVRPKSQRSAVSNGRLFAVDTRLDPRSNPWVRRCRDLIEIYIAHCGGWDAVSAPERAIIRRVASFDVELELLEKRFALNRKGADAADLELYFRGASHQRRLLESIGLKRAPKDVTPTLEDIAAEIEAERCAAVEQEDAS